MVGFDFRTACIHAASSFSYSCKLYVHFVSEDLKLSVLVLSRCKACLSDAT